MNTFLATRGQKIGNDILLIALEDDYFVDSAVVELFHHTNDCLFKKQEAHSRSETPVNNVIA